MMLRQVAIGIQVAQIHLKLILPQAIFVLEQQGAGDDAGSVRLKC
jgi:hypothetical protein